MTWTKNFTLYITFLLISLSVYGQETDEVRLSSVIRFLEDKFDVSFTYADDNIRGVMLEFPTDLDLNESIKYLNDHLRLSFKRLNARYISISPGEKKSRKICGYLYDAETSEPVFASIWTMHNNEVGEVVNTNMDGYFEILVRPGSRVNITSLGYYSMDILESDFTSCKKLQLKPEYVELNEVVISNLLTRGINRLNHGAFSIQTQDLGILPGLIEQDVLQTIQLLPGIQSVNERVADINARGGTNDQNLILWDGIRMYQTGHFFGLISAFNPYLTEDVHFIKNGSPARYANGISSTVDIRNSDEVSQNFSGGIGLNLINTDIYTKIPLSDRISLQVSARRSISDLIQTLTYKQYFDRVFSNTEVTSVQDDNGSVDVNTNNEEFFFRDLSVKLLYDPGEKDKIRLNFLQILNEISFEENATVNNMTKSQTSSLDQDNLSAGISHTRLWNPKFKTHEFAYLSRYNLRGIDFDVVNNQRLIQENEVLETGFEFDTDYSFSTRTVMKTGYQFYETGIGNLEELNNPEFRRYIKRVMRTHALFSELSHVSRSGKFSSLLGVRGNYYNKLDEFKIEPRFSLRQMIARDFSLELMGEMKSQSSTQIIDLQNDFLGIEKRRWIMADGNEIPLIQSKQLSFGMSYQKDGLLISLENYVKEVDGITSRSQGFQNQFQFERSAGGYFSTGVDFLVNIQFSQWSTWATYSWADNTYTFDEFTPSEFLSNLDIPHSVGLGVNYTWKNLEVSSGWKWHTGIPFTEPVENAEISAGEINYGAPNSERLPDYSRLDFSIKYRLDINQAKNLEFGLSVWNVMDRKNILSQYYTLNEDDELEVIQQSSLGITPNLMIRFNFN